MMRWLKLFVFCISPVICFSQWVRDDDTSKVWFEDGIYLNAEEFFINQPSLKWTEEADFSWRVRDSISRSGVLVNPQVPDHHEGNIDIRSHSILVNTPNGTQVIRKRDIWGFCFHGNPYLFESNSMSEDFIRIPVLGVVSYLNYSIYVEDPFMSPEIMYTGGGNTQIQSVQLIVDFEEKRFVKHSKKRLEEILQRDKDLFERYNSEKKRNREIYRYIKLYNQNHPIQFE